MKKLLLALMFLTGSAFANPLTTPISVNPSGEDLWGYAPIGAIEFNPSNSDNYGLAISESLFFGHVVQSDPTHVVVSPYFFTGLFAAANIGAWAQSNGNANISVDYGIMVGLPKLDSTLPEVAFSATWNTINRGDAKLFIDVAFPADILSDILVHRL